MDFWRLVLVFLFSFNTFSQSIEKINVFCKDFERCVRPKERINNIFSVPEEPESFKKKLHFILLDKSIKTMEYEFVDGTIREANIFLSFKDRIKLLSVFFHQDVSIDEESILALIPLKENDFLDLTKLEQSKKNIEDFLAIQGFRVNKITVDTQSDSKEATIVIYIHLNPRIKIKDINIQVDHKSYKKDILNAFSDLKGQGLNLIEIRSRIQQYLNQISSKGFFYAKETHAVEEKKDEAIVNINFEFGKRYQTHFYGNKIFSHQELSNLTKQEMQKGNKDLTESNIETIIAEYYNRANIYNSEITVRKIEGKTKENVPSVISYVTIIEGKKERVHNIIYNGISSLEMPPIHKIFKKSAPTIVARSYLDKAFFENFTLAIKKEYIKNGFVFVEVDKPIYEQRPDGSYNIIYNITERRQNILRNITIDGVPKGLQNEMTKIMKNKKDLPLDVLAIQEDLTNILNLAKEKGYYFSEIVNLQDKNLVKYSESFDTSEIHIVFNLDYKVIVGNPLVIGNRKTKDHIVTREILPYNGTLLTLAKIQEIENTLVGLRLFSNVTLTPLIAKIDEKENTAIVTIIAQVTERPFGSGEFSPGYRTDLGIKTAVAVSYNNLWGENHTITSTVQVNQRVESSDLDPRRQQENRRMLEGLLEVGYKIPYWPYLSFLNTKLELEIESSFRRRRFYGFDADVLTFIPRISGQFSKTLSASLMYQFESIRQFDATALKDNDTFRVGGITPSVTFDFRDNDINPTRGAYFRLSWEFSNKLFGPQTGNSVDINYYKLISRNRFYYPLKDWVIAVGVSAGHQKNFANPSGNDNTIAGYIPGIKVFRLGGPDNVRGFSDTEINRLKTGDDISDVQIDNEAYFINYKFEPRYRISDNVMINLFLDAGRVYVNDFRPLSVRASIGSGFKFITPVGGLDFDYGIKLTKKSYKNNTLQESFGRFHLTVGQF